MNNPSRKQTLALYVSAALAQLAMGEVRADSAVGVDTMLGNALNPNTLRTIPARDAEDPDTVPYARTPTGKLLGWPLAIPSRTTTAGGWSYNGEIELGGTWSGGDTKSAWFNQYKDLPDNGVYLNNFHIQADETKKGTGYFIEALGGGVGYNDQYEGINFGRYNDWKVKIYYNETPHTYTSSYRNLWSGVGSGYLTLDSLTPGGTSVSAVPPPGAAAAAYTLPNARNNLATHNSIVNAINALDESSLSVVRHTGGITLDKWITNSWRFYGSFSQEHRTGARPFGMVFGGSSPNVDMPESIDYDTNDFLGALRYDDGVNNLNLQLNVSLFRNNIDTQTVQNPTYIPATAAGVTSRGIPSATFDLYPNNDYYNLRLEYARAMPQWYHSRLTATVSLSKFKQDDDLIPSTQFNLQGVTLNGQSAYNMWNTPASNSRRSADAEIDTQLYDLSLVMRPTEKLDLNAKVRWYNNDNKTDYLACNPLTGQWGRLLEDGAGSELLTPNALGNPRGTTATSYDSAGCNLGALQSLNLLANGGSRYLRNIPYQYSKLNLELGGEYRLAPKQSINLKIAREEYQRDYRERDKTWENMLKLGYVNRAFDFGTLRASAEYGKRRGDAYNADPYAQFFSESLAPYPTANGVNVASWGHLGMNTNMRKYDLADRDRLALDLRLDLMARKDLDIGISGQYRDNNYPDSSIGRTDHQTVGTLSLDLNWQPSPKYGVSAWYSYQQASLQQNLTSEGAGCVIGTTYSFYSDGWVAAGTAARSGTTITRTVTVSGNSWGSQCLTGGPNSPLWPDSRLITMDSQEANNAFGLSGRYDFGYARLELDGTYIDGRYSQDYSYNPTAQTPGGVNAATYDALPAAQKAYITALVGSGMPDTEYSQTIVNFNLVVPISKSFSLRGLYRYEQGTINEWQYVGVAGNPVPSFNTGVANPTFANPGTAVPDAVYLDSGPQSYHTNTVALLVQMTF